MKRTTGTITEVKTLATHDGPGIRTTVFMKGCPLNCIWCCNPENKEQNIQLYFISKHCKECEKCIEACKENAIRIQKDKKIDRNHCTLCMECVVSCRYGALQKVGRKVGAEELCTEISKDSPFYKRSGGGVTLSGGEPLLQPNFAAELFRLCHQKGIHTVLDTCGYAAKEAVQKVIAHTDLVLFDIKHMNPDIHKKFTGVSCEPILENARYMAGKCDIRISLPLIPGINDSEENIKQTVQFASSIGVEFIDIVPYHQLGICKYEFLGLEPPILKKIQIPDKKLEEIIGIIKSHGLKATKGRLI